ASHAELDRYVPLIVLAVYIRRARLQLDVAQLAQRNLRSRWRGNQDVLDRLNVLAIARQQSNDQREMALAFIDVGDGLAADRRLHDGIHVARRQPIACTALAVYFDQQIGLAQLSEDSDIGDSVHR